MNFVCSWNQQKESISQRVLDTIHSNDIRYTKYKKAKKRVLLQFEKFYLLSDELRKKEAADFERVLEAIRLGKRVTHQIALKHSSRSELHSRQQFMAGFR